jgi:hypothetical protein
MRVGNETFGSLSKQGLKGGLKVPTETARGIRVSLARVLALHGECARSGARVHGGFKPENHAFLLVSDGAG